MEAQFISEWPEKNIDIHECEWYHHFDFLDQYPEIRPHYDLTQYLQSFLLPRDMHGKSFLDIGTANGFLSFEMERCGAEVVSFDAAEEADLDYIPYAGSPDRRASNREFRRRLHRGYWYAHRAVESRARAAYGTVLNMSARLGTYDVVMLGSILQHLRDPFLAIQNADHHVRGTLIICEAFYDSKEPVQRFQATPDIPNPQYWTWWLFSPAFLVNALKVLGYKKIEVEGPFIMHNIQNAYGVPSITVKGTKE